MWVFKVEFGSGFVGGKAGFWFEVRRGAERYLEGGGG